LTPAECEPDSLCANPFTQVLVDHLIRGGSRIQWLMASNFIDERPHVFQLQAGATSNPYADDWVDVGTEVVDDYVAYDDKWRVTGKTIHTHYRLRLTTPVATYHSLPAAADGALNKRDWRIAQEIIRKEELRLREMAGITGYLLKRRLAGERCPRCLDPMTDDTKNAQCSLCYGTRFTGGYFPSQCLRVDFSTKTSYVKNQNPRATSDDIVVSGRTSGKWRIFRNDVFIEHESDRRWYAHQVQHKAEVRGVPVIVQVTFRLAQFTDVIYELPAPQRFEADPLRVVPV
jgi:hypothetical protein